MGISPHLAHLFVFYYGVLSFLTPPVCLAAYAAASIAGANMMKTALQSMKLGIAAYLVPFIFAYRPALLMKGTVFEVTEACFTAVIGVIFIGIAAEGYLFRNIGIMKRVVLFLGGIVTMVPGPLFSAAGLMISAPVLLMEWRMRRKTPSLPS
jgi:TRAP-type uncharacterized transport system fused permease subunit